MTDHVFNNGVKIHIPDGTKDEVMERWTHAKFIMSILLRPDKPVQPKVRKPYTFSERSKAKRLSWKLKKERAKAMAKKK